jgi:hypothetical protein
MKGRIDTFALALALVGVQGTSPSVTAQDSGAAENQYRVARRLAAEGSDDAAQSLRKVVELDPRGPLADDALLDQALLYPVARWPEELGGIEEDPARRARGFLERIANDLAAADRAAEASYYLALLGLEPLPERDLSAADLQLLALATSQDASEWRDRARYVGAWLDEQQGNTGRARAAYQRLVVDTPDGATAGRARVGLARLDLHSGDFGRAAALLQSAIDGGVPPETEAHGLREQSVRALLTQAGQISPPARPETMAVSTGVRGVAGIAPTAEGGAVIGDRKSGLLVRLGPDGATQARWNVQGLQAVAAGPGGATYVVTSDSVQRLVDGGKTRWVAPLGDFNAVGDLAVDGLTRFWVLDRKGDRIARIEPSETEPRTIWQSRSHKLDSIAWDGRRLVAVDVRGRQLVVIHVDGSLESIGNPGVQRLDSVAADSTGRIAILDGKAGAVLFVEPNGNPIYSVYCRSVGILKPAGLAFAADGSLELFDESNGSWLRLR